MTDPAGAELSPEEKLSARVGALELIVELLIGALQASHEGAIAEMTKTVHAVLEATDDETERRELSLALDRLIGGANRDAEQDLAERVGRTGPLG